MARQEESEPGLGSHQLNPEPSFQTLLCLQECPSLVCVMLSTIFGHRSLVGCACCRQCSGAALAQPNPGATNPPGLPKPSALCLGWALAIPIPAGWQTHLALGGEWSVAEQRHHIKGEFLHFLSLKVSDPTQTSWTHNKEQPWHHLSGCHEFQGGDGVAGLNIPGWHEANQLNSPNT